MKCSKVKFANRRELNKKTQMRICSKCSETTYLTTDYYGYSFKLQRKKTASPQQEPQVSVNTLVLPENYAFNTGSSLERWSKKTPRLTSAKTATTKSVNEFYDADYNISINVDDILNSVEDDDNNNVTELGVAEYEVSSDIEELLLKTERERRLSEEEARGKETGNRPDNRTRSEDRSKKKRVKRNLRKSIRFSISKPASPETEQVIRVDVTSTIPIQELRRLELRGGGGSPADGGGGGGQPRATMINDVRKESKRTFNDNDVIKFDGEEEDFIVRCRQLALTQKRR